ncbi:MAG: response regulator transcription factor [Cellulosilyticaceae bacterium]
MYKVLIVDDERIIRIGMRTIIDWEALGFEIVDIVSDGKQALEIIHEGQVDLVITDIKMPNMDGIQLAKTLYEEKFKGQVIMLTSYGEFELARECLRYGVHDYLLKGTLRPQELIDAIESIKDKMHQKDEEEELKTVAYTVETEDATAIAETFSGYLTKNTEETLAVAFKREYQFLLLKNHKSKLEKEKLIGKQFSDYRTVVENIVAEINPKYAKPFLVFEGDWCLYAMPIHEVKDQERMLQMALQIQKLIKLYANIKVGGVLGRSVYTTQDFIESLKRCTEASELVFYTGYEQVVVEEMCEKVKYYKGTEHKGIEVQLKEKIKQGDDEGASQVLENYMNHFRKYSVHQKEVEDILNAFLQELILEYGIYLEKDKAQLGTIVECYRKSTLLEEMNHALSEFVYSICEQVLKVKDKHYRKEIVEIMEYVEAHIGEKISLTTIACQINMNESYISRLFKNETGMNIIHYINIRKMEKAKELLKHKNMIVKDVAYALGFEEQSYFNRTFNKYFGMNPKEYKNVQTRKNNTSS